MKVTLSYDNINKLKNKKIFNVSLNETAKDYEVYAVVTIENVDKYVILYGGKLIFVPDKMIKVVDQEVGYDWSYVNFVKKYRIHSYGGNKNLVVNRYLGPNLFIENKDLMLDINAMSVDSKLFKLIYLYNIEYHTKNKYYFIKNEDKFNLMDKENNTIVRNPVKYKLDYLKKEIYFIGEKEFIVFNYETKEIKKFKNKEIPLDYKLIFKYNNDFIDLT